MYWIITAISLRLIIYKRMIPLLIPFAFQVNCCSRHLSDCHTQTHEEAEGCTCGDHWNGNHHEAAHPNGLDKAHKPSKDASHSSASHKATDEELGSCLTRTENSLHLALHPGRCLLFFNKLLINREFLRVNDLLVDLFSGVWRVFGFLGPNSVRHLLLSLKF